MDTFKITDILDEDNKRMFLELWNEYGYLISDISLLSRKIIDELHKEEPDYKDLLMELDEKRKQATECLLRLEDIKREISRCLLYDFKELMRRKLAEKSCTGSSDEEGGDN